MRVFVCSILNNDEKAVNKFRIQQINNIIMSNGFLQVFMQYFVPVMVHVRSICSINAGDRGWNFFLGVTYNKKIKNEGAHLCTAKGFAKKIWGQW